MPLPKLALEPSRWNFAAYDPSRTGDELIEKSLLCDGHSRPVVWFVLPVSQSIRSSTLPAAGATGEGCASIIGGATRFETVIVPTCGVTRVPSEETRARPNWWSPFVRLVVSICVANGCDVASDTFAPSIQNSTFATSP